MNVNHCYMRNVYNEDEIQDISLVEFVNDIDWKKRKVDENDYRDPDYNCIQLYDDINMLFFDNTLERTTDIYDKGQIVLLSNKGIRLTSDYIGPSLTSLARAGISNEETWNIVLNCRKIGGHLIWPRIPFGINPSKAKSGGRGYGISDRIDVALHEVKCFLDEVKDAPIFNNSVRKSMNIETNKKWFAEIGATGFKNYCDFFKLVGSFVDEDYNIIWLEDPQIGKLNKKQMELYVKENITAISNRNKAICKSINKE